MLENDINTSSRFHFAEYYAIEANLTEIECSFFFYLIELSLLDITISQELYSKIAAAALHLTLQTTHGGNVNKISRSSRIETTSGDNIGSFWSDRLVDCTGYLEFDLISCIKLIHDQHVKVSHEAQSLRNFDRTVTFTDNMSEWDSNRTLCKNLIEKYNQKSNFYVSTKFLSVSNDRLWLGEKCHLEIQTNLSSVPRSTETFLSPITTGFSNNSFDSLEEFVLCDKNGTNPSPVKSICFGSPSSKNSIRSENFGIHSISKFTDSDFYEPAKKNTNLRSPLSQSVHLDFDFDDKSLPSNYSESLFNSKAKMRRKSSTLEKKTC